MPGSNRKNKELTFKIKQKNDELLLPLDKQGSSNINCLSTMFVF